ncbi:MAG: DUF859 family phage minor structural protein [Finegoldia sp.]|nr:DUF859 family phage minor structural protein [Finegoldia sp.]
MATYTGSTPYSLYADFKVDLNVKSQSQSANTSTISYRIYLQSVNGGHYTSGTNRPVTLTVDGKSIVNISTTYDFAVGESYTFKTGEFTVNHNSDGTKRISFSATASTHLGMCSLSSTMTLPTISRKFAVRVLDDSGYQRNEATVGDIVNVAIDNPANTPGTLVAVFKDYSETIGSVTGSKIFYYTIPTSFNAKFTGYDPQPLTFRLTSSDGQSASQTISITPTSLSKPTVSSISIVNTNIGISNIFGSATVQNLSEIEVTVNASSDVGIKTYEVIVDGYRHITSSNKIDIGKIRSSGSVTFEVIVIDNNGTKSSTYTKTVTFKEYKVPGASIDSVTRLGKGISIDVSAYHTVSSTTYDNNVMTLTVEVKATTETTYTQKHIANVSISNYDQTIDLGSTYDPYTAYDIRVTVKDKFNTYVAIQRVAQDVIGIVIDKDNNNIGIGKMPEIEGSNSVFTDGDIKCGDIKCGTMNANYTNGGIVNATGINSDGKILSKGYIEAPNIYTQNNYYYKNSKMGIITAETMEQRDIQATDGTAIRELFLKISEMNNISYANKVSYGQTYTNIYSLDLSKYNFKAVHIGTVFLMGSSNAGTAVVTTGVDTTSIKFRFVDMLGSTSVTRINPGIYVRGEV